MEKKNKTMRKEFIEIISQPAIRCDNETVENFEDRGINMENLNCFIDLHLHLDGSLSVPAVRKLADIQGIALPEEDKVIHDMLAVSEGCRDLNEYLTKFEFPCSLLQTEEAISTAVDILGEELKAQGLIYAEIRFAPQKHCLKGLDQERVVAAAIEGMKKWDLRSNLILCCMRGRDNREENMETVRVAEKYYGKGVCALDLAGAEALFRTEDFSDIFTAAKAKGIRFTIHAGEAAGAESVWKALELGAIRIGHGVRSAEDESLLNRLAEEGIALELCPTSNLNTAVFHDLKEYPILAMMKKGVKVTVNTDNMSVSRTTLRREYRDLIETFDLTCEQVKRLMMNSAEVSFADEGVKRELKEKIARSLEKLQ